jgi:crotonobetainyl-CoA:carnitine CoA-transferase CaiB-like acyl-CoA transferase
VALPLEGVRVLDMASILAGPYGATLLGDMGADVIKIEPPAGDEARAIGPGIGNDSGFFIGVNRNKRGIVLDLARPEGKDIYFRLVETADVVIENLRPGAKYRLGVAYEETRRRNPRIIYISVSTYGQSGPYAERPGIDPLAQALSGFMSVTGETGGRPLKAGPPLADAACANLVALAAMLGLWSREKEGVGQRIEVSLLDAFINSQVSQAGQFLLTGYMQPRLGNSSPFFSPYGSFTCRDGKTIQIMAHNDKFFQNICRALEREDLVTDVRFLTNADRLANREELDREIQACFSRFDSAEMMRRFVAADAMAAPVNSYRETFSDPQVIHNRMAAEVRHALAGNIRVPGVPIKLEKTPGTVRRAPPSLGEHTDEVLKELGITDGETADLRRSGVIK